MPNLFLKELRMMNTGKATGLIGAVAEVMASYF